MSSFTERERIIPKEIREDELWNAARIRTRASVERFMQAISDPEQPVRYAIQPHFPIEEEWTHDLTGNVGSMGFPYEGSSHDPLDIVAYVDRVKEELDPVTGDKQLAIFALKQPLLFKGLSLYQEELRRYAQEQQILAAD